MSAPEILPELTLAQLVLRHADTHPDALALRQKTASGWVDIDWATFAKRARECAAGLLELGLEAPRHVAMFADNRSEWMIAQIATGLINGVALGCYPTSSAEDLRHALGYADVQVLVCQDENFLRKIHDIRDDLKGLRHIILMDAGADDSVLSLAGLEAMGAAALAKTPDLLDDFIARQSADHVGLMVYTSGSTGAPKAAMLTYRNMRAQAQGFGRRLNYQL